MIESENPSPPPAFALEVLSGLGEETVFDLVDRMSVSSDPTQAWERLVGMARTDPAMLNDEVLRRRAVAIALWSRALSRAVSLYPGILAAGPTPDSSITLQVRAALCGIAGDDLAGAIGLAEATSRFSAAMDTIVASHLEAARSSVAEFHDGVDQLQFAVIAMGKWGAGELNYSSDVDMIFVYGSAGEDSGAVRPAALAVASRLISNLSSATFDGPGLRVDTDLRPEGAMGPLTRSLEGYGRYYREWAEAWELQALLKARFAAGDVELGDQFSAMSQEMLWQRGLEPEALRGIRRIKAQTEQNADSRDIKRARGGIRDIEFSTQILQLVHGRLEEELRISGTTEAISRLAELGFIESTDRDDLIGAYDFLRNLEHRIQLWDLRQTQLMPTDPDDLMRLGRAMGFSVDAGRALVDKLGAVRSMVRDIHERLYFRPILDALVGSTSARLGVDQAALRLEVLGFVDVRAATKALTELTTGLTRRSRVMQQVLPLMLDWLSQSPDPDLGLAQLRTLLAHTSDHSALVTLLQTNPLAGERLCRILGTSRLMGTLLDRIPEFIPRLADDDQVRHIRDAEAETERLLGLLDSRPDPEAKIGTIRRSIRRRRLRVAARDILGEADTGETVAALSAGADAAMRGALHVLADPEDFAVIAMGKWGGRELSYESDLDLMYVYRDDTTRDDSFRTAADLVRVLSEPSRHGWGYELDAGLRPEGRNGPLARSLDGYKRYYEKWAEPWELLALIKARPAGGDTDVADEFTEMLAPIVWRTSLPSSVLQSVRMIKARVESERIPPDEDPDYHLKLGPGGLSDVEFLAQLLQLEYGGKHPELRVPGTMEALAHLAGVGLLSDTEIAALEDAYLFCTRVRLRLHLQTGGVTDSLPTEPRLLSQLATSLGYDRATDLREEYRRLTRRARRVFEKRFY